MIDWWLGLYGWTRTTRIYPENVLGGGYYVVWSHPFFGEVEFKVS